MSKKSNIIKFPQNPKIKGTLYEDDEPFDFEKGIYIRKFFDSEDYAGLVRHFKERAERSPDDLYAQCYLGDAYVRNGEYDKAIEIMVKHHKNTLGSLIITM